MRRTRPFLAIAVILLVSTLPLPAAPIPSSDREADMAVVNDVLARQDVARALAGTGLAPQEIEQRVAALSDQDLHSLAGNLDQIQAAGAMDRDTMWIVIYVLLGVLLIALLV